ncbi:MAG: D-3-phosphoglycerate dehydrogenase [Methylocystaceae bacterium]|nr:MAG: D-3-phosphoglycerate dehydrogenase [Methylocystaceae bacterium]
MPPRVLISDSLSPAAAQIFRLRGLDVDFEPTLGKDKDKLAAAIADYDGLAIRSATKVTADIFARAPRLKVVGRAGIGVDNVDVAAATARGVIVMNTPFGNSITTAEHAIALMFALAREIPAADASTQAGKWEKNRFMGVEITGKTLGVVGCGNVGANVAERALGLKMRVIAFDPYLTQERASELGVEKVDLDELLARADFITLHTPLTPQTKNILSAENLAKTCKGVRIINCASTTAMSPAPPSTCSRRSRRPKTHCSGIRTSSARRTSALRRARRRRRSRCRSPSRWRIISPEARSPTR